MEPEDIIADMIEGESIEIDEMQESEVAETELQPKSRREVESIVQSAISDAVDFIESEISDDRIRAQRYYDGEVDLSLIHI